MSKTRIIQVTTLGISLAATAGLAGCQAPPTADNVGKRTQAITDVDHTPVERQSIGNCWLYAQATWVESIALTANPAEELDVSQSYWTYWHWFDQIDRSSGYNDEIQTGGNQYVANQIVRQRGFMNEPDFVVEDSLEEMSERQDLALSRINTKLENGDLEDATGEEIRDALDEAWELPDEVRAELDQVFGEDGQESLSWGTADTTGTSIRTADELPVSYKSRYNGSTEVVQDATLSDAMSDWSMRNFPYSESARRDFIRNVQQALHDKQPVIITWSVDFNALENEDNGRGGVIQPANPGGGRQAGPTGRPHDRARGLRSHHPELRLARGRRHPRPSRCRRCREARCGPGRRDRDTLLAHEELVGRRSPRSHVRARLPRLPRPVHGLPHRGHPLLSRREPDVQRRLSWRDNPVVLRHSAAGLQRLLARDCKPTMTAAGGVPPARVHGCVRDLHFASVPTGVASQAGWCWIDVM